MKTCNRGGLIHRLGRAARAAAVMLAAFTASLAGCARVTEHLVLEPDGSGRVTIDVVVEPTVAMQIGGVRQMSGGDAAAAYPPVSAEHAEALFPGEGFRVSYEQPEAPADAGEFASWRRRRVTASFDDVNALLDSPWAEAHQLSLRRDEENGELELRMRHAFAVAAGAMEAEEDDLAPHEAGQFSMVERARQTMRLAFSVTLPGDAVDASARGGFEPAVDGRRVTWTLAASDPPAADAALAEALRGPLTARCRLEGVTFEPAGGPRPGTVSFDALEAGELSASAEVDADAVRGAAGFELVHLRDTRTIDLTGEAWGGDDGLSLTGVLSFPEAVSPSTLRPAEVVAAESASGEDLAVREDDRGTRRHVRHGFGGGSVTAPVARDGRVYHPVQLTLEPPPIDDAELARVEATVTADFGSGARLVKVPAAIKEVAEMGHAVHVDDGALAGAGFDELAEAGVEIESLSATLAGFYTTINLSLGEAGAHRLRDVHCFDAAGEPWPMMRQPFGGGPSTWRNYTIAGRPEPPLSLAVVIAAGGAEVEIPIVLERVPLPVAAAE